MGTLVASGMGIAVGWSNVAVGDAGRSVGSCEGVGALSGGGSVDWGADVGEPAGVTGASAAQDTTNKEPSARSPAKTPAKTYTLPTAVFPTTITPPTVSIRFRGPPGSPSLSDRHAFCSCDGSSGIITIVIRKRVFRR